MRSPNSAETALASMTHARLRVSQGDVAGARRILDEILRDSPGHREARALRDDVEREVRRDVITAYEVFETARASADLAQRAVVVARENLRVNQERYRVGGTTILDLLTAQVSLVEAEAALVQALQAERLALAGLEALLGRRIYGT